MIQPIDFACLPAAVGPAPRRQTRQVALRWGSRVVRLGGSAPVMVQSMTNTDTADAVATAIQIKALAQAGSEVVRITVNSPEAAAEVEAIRAQLDRMGVDVPLVGDFHYNGHKLLAEYPGCAQSLSAYRINPGNIGRGTRREDNFAQMIEIAARHGKPVRWTRTRSARSRGWPMRCCARRWCARPSRTRSAPRSSAWAAT